MTLPDDLQSPRSRSPITYAKVLLVEGRDVFEFFKALLRHLSLLTEIEIRNFGGVNQLPTYLRTLTVTPGYSEVTSLAIIRDAEMDLDTAFKFVGSSLRQAGLSVPQQPGGQVIGQPKISIFLLPDCLNPGMLETLCLQAISSDPVMPCVEQYFQCVQAQTGLELNNPSKAHLHTFLSSKPEPGLLLGQAAHRGYFPWDSPVFDRLKQFLRAL